MPYTDFLHALRIIPRAIRHLKRPYDTLANDAAGPNTLSLDTEIFWGVIYRYAEYCVTAPLLFISVVCLLYVDAPAWYATPLSLNWLQF